MKRTVKEKLAVKRNRLDSQKKIRITRLLGSFLKLFVCTLIAFKDFIDQNGYLLVNCLFLFFGVARLVFVKILHLREKLIAKRLVCYGKILKLNSVKVNCVFKHTRYVIGYISDSLALVKDFLKEAVILLLSALALKVRLNISIERTRPYGFLIPIRLHLLKDNSLNCLDATRVDVHKIRLIHSEKKRDIRNQSDIQLTAVCRIIFDFKPANIGTTRR